MENFYVTLPSNSSMNIYPENSLSHYTTRLRKPLNLTGKWEVALVEASVPTQWKKWMVIINDKQYIRLGLGIWGKDARKPTKKKFFRAKVKSGVYDTPKELENALNTAFRDLQRSIHKNKLFSKQTPREERAFEYNSEHNAIIGSIHTPLIVSNNLGRILGLTDTGRPWLSIPSSLKNAKPLNNKTIKVNHLYIYSDIIEYTIVGDTITPLLRIVPMQSYIGTTSIDHYTHIFNKPHYTPVSRQHIETIHIDIRNDLGINIPFIDGNKCIIKLHFRQRRQ